MKNYIIILFLILAQSGMLICETTTEADKTEICEDNDELTIDMIGLLGGDFLINYDPSIRLGEWQLGLTAGIYSKTIALGAGFSYDLERENGKLFKADCTRGFVGNLSFLITTKQAWFTPGFGYKIVVHKDWIGKYLIIEPQLQANLGITFFLGLNLNVGIGL